MFCNFICNQNIFLKSEREILNKSIEIESVVLTGRSLAQN